MRAVILGLTGLLIAGDATAADYLRGSSYEGAPAGYNWAGIYIGGQAGYSEAAVSYDTSARTATDRLLRPTFESDANLAKWPAPSRSDSRGSSYGGFVGYNSQWGDVVLGLELNYNRASLSTTSTKQVIALTGAPVPAGDPPAIATMDYAAQMRITDYGALRFRAGYAWNWLMPYGTVGLAVGRADLVRSAAVRYDPAPPPNAPPFTNYTDTETRNGAFTVGYSAGVGVDIGLMPGVFVRGEYEFVQLNTIKGMTAHLNTFRVAAAVKF